MNIEIKRLNSQSADFWQKLEELQAWDTASDDVLLKTVTDIIDSVRSRGDAALI